MSEALSGRVPGGKAAERAVTLAGALAECGVARLALWGPGRRESKLEARETDLPGVIMGAGAGTLLSCPALGLRIEVTKRWISWTAPDSPGARAFAESLGRALTKG